MSRSIAYAALLVLGTVTGAKTAPLDQLTPAPTVDDLLDNLEATAAPEPEGRVRLDAWVQARGAGRELVVVIEPEGRTKLIADPGITLTPEADAPGVEWQVPLPHRVSEPGTDYWEGEQALRVPFRAADGIPLDFTVEYAWCVLDYQCFFDEETLSVANRIN